MRLYSAAGIFYSLFMRKPEPKNEKTLSLAEISAWLAEECGSLRFGAKAAAVYNPLVYAARPHALYLKLAGGAPKKVIFLGMNPGPWGMAQTGVPFGEVAAVRDWLGICAPTGQPEKTHPKRPVQGFDCARSEVSGRRLWGLFRERFGTPKEFFREHYVANYCPLVFMDSGGANITPDKLPAPESRRLFEICDRALADTIRALRPRWVIGVGTFAEKRIEIVREAFFAKPAAFSAARIPHPSPANPQANSGWAKNVSAALREKGVWA
jgi:single-strand selective monofunctional uracil DNA glycosylase